VVLARFSMRCRSGLYHRQRAWPCRWRICGESTRGHSGRKGQERGRRVLRVGRHAESRGTLTTSSGCCSPRLILTTPCPQVLRVLALKVLGAAYT
jgi:hypothetical protein